MIELNHETVKLEILSPANCLPKKNNKIPFKLLSLSINLHETKINENVEWENFGKELHDCMIKALTSIG